MSAVAVADKRANERRVRELVDRFRAAPFISVPHHNAKKEIDRRAA